MIYRNEAAFSQALVKVLRQHGWFVQRIESGTMGKGIPDIYSITPKGCPVWIELKCVHANLYRQFIVPWRPGQQAWMHQVTLMKQECITLVAFNHALVALSHRQIYPANKVDLATSNYFLTNTISDMVGILSEESL